MKRINLELSGASVNMIINALIRWAISCRSKGTATLARNLAAEVRAQRNKAKETCATGTYTYSVDMTPAMKAQAEGRVMRKHKEPVGTWDLHQYSGTGRLNSSKPNKANTRNTGIVIKADKELSPHGSKGYRIMNIKALTRDKLPTEYINGECVWYEPNTKTLKSKRRGLGSRIPKYPEYTICNELVKGDRYPEGVYKQRMEFIEKCGERLGKINASAPAWDGTDEVRI